MDIEYEARDQRLLDDMSSGFESTFSFLTSGSNRINRLLLSGRGNRKLCCYMSLAITALLFILYFMIHSALYSTSSKLPPVSNTVSSSLSSAHVIASEHPVGLWWSLSRRLNWTKETYKRNQNHKNMGQNKSPVDQLKFWFFFSSCFRYYILVAPFVKWRMEFVTSWEVRCFIVKRTSNYRHK